MEREELIAYDKWLTRRKWGTVEIISPEKAADLYLAEYPLPPAEGAEEIIESILESLGDPINIHNHAFEIRPYTVDHKTEWWIFHKEVASGEPLAQWLDKFATLHAQKLADKMVEDELVTFLIKRDYPHAMQDECVMTMVKHIVDEYLKSRDSHEQHR